ncbi:hypothetical protein KDW67_19425 [Burkholderia cenocepacia]|uniref:hypothetical protein n=1 Tax=Burkholderia cenocepacia TaxID=95486 RepID=UPI00097C1DDE|nr:hypothetical protein [Burkholderia cenocepacia]AQQ46733.1 hypothetical protein A8F32_13070 [Burkholderia cenocepacia]MBR8262150.1 hypothetical protein [Burkholderia cenocepacia]ONI97069.1 hypothetical protein A8F33_33190 [Burkholderia cenocepacia]ONJ01595.1 hypothetical protein A8F53_16425 [Burkholderia cenocepacia]ONJ33919.1 hypothetical protein A8F38_07355 [Burkholderia cenocepacia]
MTTKELPAFVELDNVTFNRARAAIAILADGHERQGNELEGLKALVAKLTETVRAQAQQIAEMRAGFEETHADFTATVQQQEQAVHQQLTELGAEFAALGDELQEVEERANARIDSAVAAYAVVAAKQEQVQAESQDDKPVQVPVARPIRKSAEDLQRTRDLISQIVANQKVSTTEQPARNALRFITTQPPVIEAPTPSVQETDDEEEARADAALAVAREKVRIAKARDKIRRAEKVTVARPLLEDETEEWLDDDADEPVTRKRDGRMGRGWSLDDVKVTEEELMECV